jgi:pyrroloquinoline-quinone synthase
MFSNDMIARLDSMIAERSLLHHPFYQAWTAGEIGIERLRNYAIKYYPYVDAFPRYISAIHSRCTNLATRRALLENLIEEERGAENHPELRLRFAEGLGVARETVLDTAPSTAAQKLIGTFVELTSNGSIAASIAALYAYESQVPEIASAKVAGLRNFYEINDERALGFFAVQ